MRDAVVSYARRFRGRLAEYMVADELFQLSSPRSLPGATFRNTADIIAALGDMLAALASGTRRCYH